MNKPPLRQRVFQMTLSVILAIILWIALVGSRPVHPS